MEQQNFIDMIQALLDNCQIQNYQANDSENQLTILVNLIQDLNLLLMESITHPNKEQMTQICKQLSLNFNYSRENLFQVIQNQTLQWEILESIDWGKIIILKKNLNQIFEQLQQYPKNVTQFQQNYISALDQFIAQYFHQQLTILIQKDMEQNQLNQSEKITIQMTELRDNSFFGKFELNQTYYQGVIQILKLKYRGDQVYIDKLKGIVKASNFLNNFQQEAGNAMTIFKEVEQKIQNENFSLIRLKNCSLAGAYFIECNFKGSILVNAEISSCWFIDCCLDNVRWKNITDNALTELKGHKEQISSLAFNFNDKILASGSSDNTIKLWDTNTQKLIKVFEVNNFVQSLAFSHFGLVLVFGGWNSIIKFVNVKTGKQSLLLPKSRIKIKILVFSSDGQVLASSDGNMNISLWNYKQQKQIRVYRELQHPTNCLIFSQNNKNLTLGNSNSQIYILDINIWKLKYILKGHEDSVRSVAYSKDEQFLVSGSQDCTIIIWNLQSQTQVKRFLGHQKPVLCVAFSSTDQYVISGSQDGTIRLWDIESSKEIKKSIGYNSQIGYIQIFSEDLIVTSYLFRQNEIQLWNRRELQQHLQQIGHSESVMSIALTPDGKHLISGSVDKTIKIWNIRLGTLEKQLDEQTSGVYFVAVSPDGKLLISCCLDNLIHVWSMQTYKEIKQFQGHQGQVLSVTFSLNSKYCVSGSSDKTLRLWNIKKGRQLRILEIHGFSISTVLFSPNGNLFANISQNKKVCIRNTTNYKKLKLLNYNRSSIHTISFSQSGLNIISGNSDRLIYIWNVELGILIQKLSGHYNLISSVAFFSNDLYIVSASLKTLKIWDAKSGKEIQTLIGHEYEINSIAINDQLLISGSFDKNIIFWQTKKEQINFRPIKILSQVQRKNCFAQSTFNNSQLFKTDGENLIRNFSQNIK